MEGISGTQQNRVSPDTPTLREAFAVWLKVGLLSFGGPAGQIALMHRLLVDERKWIDEDRFLQGLNFCMLLPGPEAQQLATYIGWRLHGVLGGVIAGLLFVLPGAVVIFLLSVLYYLFRDVSVIEGVLFGVQAAVIAIVLEALMKISKRALKSRAAYIVAGIAFVAIFLFGAPFPLIVVSAALIGFMSSKAGRNWFLVKSNIAAETENVTASKISARGAFIAAAACLALWLAPIVGLWIVAGPEHVFTQEALFFSKMAVVTFGGAYAVLAYVAQQAVETYQWLSPGEMIAGLGLAETTPGPLVLVLQFVGFLGAAHGATGLHPVVAGAAGSLIVLWTTFLPCFLWIFAGGPFIEKLRRAKALNAALAAVTAAVVGVVLNLSIWFAAHVFFRRVNDMRYGAIDTIVPDIASLDWIAFAIAAGSAIAVFRFKIGLLPLLAGAAAFGALITVLA